MSNLRLKPWLVVCGLLVMPWRAQAQDTSGAGFFPFRGSARTAGLAGAFTAVADDVAGLQWNPAGMTQVATRQAGVNFKVNGDGGDYLNVSYIEPVRQGKFGGGFTYINATDGAGRRDNVFQFTYGQAFTNELSFGANLRYQTADAGATTDQNFSFDFGLLFRPKRYKQWAVGLTALDINEPSFTGIGLQKRIFNLGLAYHPDEYTTLALDWYDIGSLAHRGQARFGAERQVTRNIAVRAGVAQDTFGVGLSLMYKYFTFDYGFQRLSGAPDMNMISVTANF
ncbi:MAG: hypothetical protein HZB16_05230 [Armatimonadetes bacterium]|nr:hypothetical protein [Armatimonadota bacterium]